MNKKTIYAVLISTLFLSVFHFFLACVYHYTTTPSDVASVNLMILLAGVTASVIGHIIKLHDNMPENKALNVSLPMSLAVETEKHLHRVNRSEEVTDGVLRNDSLLLRSAILKEIEDVDKSINHENQDSLL